MSNVRFLYNTIFDQATLAVVPPEAAADPEFPLAFLQTTIRRQAMKTTGTGNLILQIDMGSPIVASALGLVEHDLHPATVVTVRAYSDAFATEIFSQSFEAIGPIIPWGEGFWGAFDWFGYPSQEDLAAYPEIAGAYWFDQRLAARYWSVEFANGEGASNEFYLGRMLLGDYWEPGCNFRYGHKDEDHDPSKTSESLGGVLFSNQKSFYRLLKFELGKVTDLEAYSHFKKMCRHVGTSSDFILQLIDQTPKQKAMTTLYGRFTKNPVLTSRTKNLNGAQFLFREVV